MTAETLIEQVGELPPVSEAALKLLKLLGNPDHDLSEVVRAVQCDGILTAKVLRACNSAYRGLRDPIASIEQAALHLGQQEILRVVLALNVGSTLNRSLAGYAVGESELWKHALTTALAAEHLAHQIPACPFEAPVAYTAGLLHDIGKVVLNRALTPDIQATIRSQIKQSGSSRPEAERSVIGTDHAEVGALLLACWKLPEDIIEAAANHHAPPLTRPAPLSAVVHVANCVAHAVGSAPGWDGYATRVDEPVAETLGLDSNGLEQAMIAVHIALSNVRQFLAIQ
jgi:putative nucleotidyltransferase with HDIG domain